MIAVVVVAAIFAGNLTLTAGASIPPGATVGARWHTPATAASHAQSNDLTCSDFSSQADAQAVYDADPTDPFGLDLDLDGVACETPIVTPANRDDRDEPVASPLPASPAATPEATPEAAPEASPPATLRDRLLTPTPAPDTYNCEDFPDQEAAQAVFDQDPTDPHHLDPSGDGFACSMLPSRAGAPSR